MAFNNQTTTSFWENEPQMGLSDVQRRRLANEGLRTIDDFFDFKADQIDQAIKNMKTSVPDVLPIPEQRDEDGTIVRAGIEGIRGIPPCLVPAKCVLRLKVASIAYHYYLDTGRTPTPANMNYTLVLRGFYEEYEAIDKMSEADSPSIPQLSKNMTVIRWVESFKDHLSRVFGVRKCPLTYLIRSEVEVEDEELAPLLPGKAYSEKHGSILEEMVHRLSHNDSLYRIDNAMLFSKLDEATRGTIYAPVIKPYAKSKDGRKSFLALIGSHAGDDKWETLQKTQTKFLVNQKWNGRQFGLDKFCNMHRSSYIQLQEAANHVDFQLPNEHTRVGYLLDNLENNDPDLRAAIASIRANTNGMRDDFEKSVTFLLPVCPYRKAKSNKNSQSDGYAEISDVNALRNGQSTKTGVDLRWHTAEEYKQLSKAQRKELYEWQNSKKGKQAIKKQKEAYLASKGGGGRTDLNKLTKKQLIARVASVEAGHGSKSGGGGAKAANNDSSHGPIMFTEAQVFALLGASEPDRDSDNNNNQEKNNNDKRNSDSSGNGGANLSSLQLQSILKRQKRN